MLKKFLDDRFPEHFRVFQVPGLFGKSRFLEHKSFLQWFYEHDGGNITSKSKVRLRTYRLTCSQYWHYLSLKWKYLLLILGATFWFRNFFLVIIKLNYSLQIADWNARYFWYKFWLQPKMARELSGNPDLHF